MLGRRRDDDRVEICERSWAIKVHSIIFFTFFFNLLKSALNGGKTS